MPAKKEITKKSCTYRFSEETKKKIQELSKVWQSPSNTSVIENAVKLAHAAATGSK